ncbi:MAG: dUTP diphosphatase [Nanoarchaeota archaeon]
MSGADKLELKVKKLHNDATIPKYAKDGDAGLDLFCINDFSLLPGEIYSAGTGISIELPKGYEAQIRPRSGLAARYGISIVNSPGTIDSGYRGEIKVILINHGSQNYNAKKGDRIAQMIIHKYEEVGVVELEELSETERGDGGLGSTGH